MMDSYLTVFKTENEGNVEFGFKLFVYVFQSLLE